MIDDDLYLRVLNLKLRYQNAIDDSGDLSYLEELESIAKNITNYSTDMAEVRSYENLRARCLVVLINNSHADYRSRKVHELIDMLEVAYNLYSLDFDHHDLRVRMLAITRYIHISVNLEKISNDTINVNPELRNLLRFHHSLKKKRTLRNT